MEGNVEEKKQQGRTEKGKKHDPAEDKKKSIAREVIGTIAYVAVICLVVFLVLRFVGQRTVVNGHSMDTTLANGENLIMDKLSYHFSDPERFDIVIFPGPAEEGEHPYFIKRVIGLPGETVQVSGGAVYINGELLESDIYGLEPMTSAGEAADPITLGPDEYFVLGDNRNHSSDSRDPSVGVLHREELIGKAWVRIYPFDKMGVIRHE